MLNCSPFKGQHADTGVMYLYMLCFSTPFQLVCYLFPIQTTCSQENLPSFFSHAYICTWIWQHSKATFLRVNITWSEMGKQNIQRSIFKSLCTLGTSFWILHMKWRVYAMWLCFCWYWAMPDYLILHYCHCPKCDCHLVNSSHP